MPHPNKPSGPSQQVSPQHQTAITPTPTRRSFIVWGIWGVVGIIAASAAIPIAILSSRPSKPKQLKYFAVALADDLPETGIKKLDVTIHGGDKPDSRVFIKRDTDGSLTAFSAVCTHLGCLINYNAIKKVFICPCHGGKYDLDGNVVSGPPPASLNRLPVKIEGGRVWVGFEV